MVRGNATKKSMAIKEQSISSVAKGAKPKIYTESDQILTDLQSELSELKGRMVNLEDEQEKNRDLLETLSFKEDLSADLYDSYKGEVESNKENYSVIANVMHGLKSPVSNVVENLEGIITNISDVETQESLRECMDTASFVLDTFNEVEDFCRTASGYQPSNQKSVEIRSYFREIIAKLQSKPDYKEGHSLRLLIDKNLPEESPLYTEVIDRSLTGLLDEVRNSLSSSLITVTVACETAEERFGLQLTDLTVTIDADQVSDLEWTNSWVEDIQTNQSKLMGSGFHLLQNRDLLRHIGGSLEPILQTGKIRGFKFNVPLTY